MQLEVAFRSFASSRPSLPNFLLSPFFMTQWARAQDLRRRTRHETMRRVVTGKIMPLDGYPSTDELMRSLEGEFQIVALSGVGRGEASLVMYGLQQHKVTMEEEVQIEMVRPTGVCQLAAS